MAGMLRPGVQEGYHHDPPPQFLQQQAGIQQPGIPMVMITQNGQRMVMPASEWHRMHGQPGGMPQGMNGGAMVNGVPAGMQMFQQTQQGGRMVMVPSGMQVSSSGIHHQQFVRPPPQQGTPQMYVRHGEPIRPTITIPETTSEPSPHSTHMQTPSQAGPTPVFRTPQPPGMSLAPPGWHATPSVGIRTPVSAVPSQGPPQQQQQQGKISFLPPRAIPQPSPQPSVQELELREETQPPPSASAGVPVTPGYGRVDMRSASGTPGGASLALLGMQGMTPNSAQNLQHTQQQQHAQLQQQQQQHVQQQQQQHVQQQQQQQQHIQNQQYVQQNPHITQQQHAHLAAQQHAQLAAQQQQRGMQTVFLPNGQSMLIVRQTPPLHHQQQGHGTPQAHQVPNQHQMQQQQMNEWRRGVMPPGAEAVGWGEVTDVGSCLLPGAASNRLTELAHALREASQTNELAAWKALVGQFFGVGSVVYYSLVHQGNGASKVFDIPHCSIARWFTTLFDASNTLLTLDIPAPVEEYILHDETSSQPLVRGTRVESPRVCWVFRNTACGSVVRTYGWLRAVMTPDFGQGVLKIERLEVYYQVAEEFVPRHLAARLERDSKPDDEDEDERGEVVAGFEGMVRRRNFKPSVELPPPLGPYGVSEQVLRFLELATTMLALRSLMERSVAESSNPRDTLKRAVADLRTSSDGSDSVDTKSIIGTPASNLLTMNGTASYLGPAEPHDQLEPPRDPSATPAPDQKPTVSPLTSVPATPKTKQLPPPPVPHSGPPSGSTGTTTALPSPSSKSMPPPKLVISLKRKNASGAGTTAAQAEEDAVRPSKKAAPSPKTRRKNGEKARAEAT